MSTKEQPRDEAVAEPSDGMRAAAEVQSIGFIVDPSARRWVHYLVAYYAVLLALAGSVLIFLIVAYPEPALNGNGSSTSNPSINTMMIDPLVRDLAFMACGAIIGSSLYHIQKLYQFYIKKNKLLDRRWAGKYVLGPWEAIALSAVVLSILQGGAEMIGGGGAGGSSSSHSFGLVGIGALVGFGSRDAIGWLGNLARNMFSGTSP